MIQHRGVPLVAGIFFLFAILLAGLRPLWLDEVLQLIETRKPTVGHLLAGLPSNSGAAPLGYLVQRASLTITGYSERRARLPFTLWATLSIFLVAVIARELGLKRTWIAAAVFAAFPMTLRYATESRIYAQGLALSLVATLIYLRLAKRPRASLAAAYTIALIAAAYTQPYAVSVAGAHLLWSLLCGDRRTFLLGLVSAMSTVLAFLPWYLWSREGWESTLGPTALHFSASAKTPLMIFREITGAGYWGGALLAVLCGLAIAARVPSRRSLAFLIASIAAPLAIVFAADAIFNYFIAARQFIWILPAVAILAAFSFESHPRIAPVLLLAFGAVCAWHNIRFFGKQEENWDLAARSIRERIGPGGCLAVAPPADARIYEYFQPGLQAARCRAPHMVLAITPYTTAEQLGTALAQFSAEGHVRQRETHIGKSLIVEFRRDAARPD